MKRFLLIACCILIFFLPAFLLGNHGLELKNPFEAHLGERFDSLNVRFVGNWPFSWGHAVAHDTERGLVFSASGGGVYILDCNNPLIPFEISQSIRTRGFVLSLEYNETANSLFIADQIGLEIWNVANPSAPNKIGSYDTRGYAEDLAMEDTFAYIADGEFGLQIINISDPANPIKIGELDTPGYAAGISIADSIAYVADTDSGIRVIDVSSPSSPLEIGAFMNNSLIFYDICISDTFAYVGTQYNGCEGKLLVMHIAEPANPVLLGECTVSQEIRRVEVNGSRAYLGKYHLYIVDISIPSNPYQVGFNEIKAFGIDILYPLAYVSSSKFRILDISDPSTPIVISSYDTRSIHKYAVEVSGSFAYTVDDNGTFWVLDISNPALPQDMGHCSTNAHNQYIDIFIQEPYAYVVNGWGGTMHTIIDISDPSNPSVVGATHLPTKPTGIHVVDTLAFIADADRLRIQSVSDPSWPHGIGNCVISGEAFRVFATESYAYVVSYIEGLKIIDVTDPTGPHQIASYDAAGQNTDVFVSGDYAYLSSTFDRFEIIDIHDPLNPVGVGFLPINGYSVVVSGSYAFLSDWPYLHVVAISDPAHPMEVGYYEVPSGGFPCNLDVEGNLIVRACSDCAIQVYEFCCAGTEEEQPQPIPHPSTIKVLQNPVAGNHIELFIHGVASTITLELYNLLGQKVKTYSCAPSSNTAQSLDIQGIPAGTYFLRTRQRGSQAMKVQILR